jgi:tRNA-binding protein
MSDDQLSLISWADFEKIEIRTGTITNAELFPGAQKPAYQLFIDFGPYGIKRSSAQITDYYKPQNLIGKQVVAVINFPVKRIACFSSECLVLGAVETSGKVILLSMDKPASDGLRIA